MYIWDIYVEICTSKVCTVEICTVDICTDENVHLRYAQLRYVQLRYVQWTHVHCTVDIWAVLKGYLWWLWVLGDNKSNTPHYKAGIPNVKKHQTCKKNRFAWESCFFLGWVE